MKVLKQQLILITKVKVGLILSCFIVLLKSKAIELGAEFIKGEVKSISEIKAKTIISAAGCWTKELLEDIPVVPQKHTVFRVKCPNILKKCL